MTSLSIFPAWLSKKLTERGAQKRLASAVKRSPSTVSKWASGEVTPEPENVVKIAKLFGESPRFLLRMTHPELTEALEIDGLLDPHDCWAALGLAVKPEMRAEVVARARLSVVLQDAGIVNDVLALVRLFLGPLMDPKVKIPPEKIEEIRRALAAVRGGPSVASRPKGHGGQRRSGPSGTV